jgi:hypothetical protein
VNGRRLEDGRYPEQPGDYSRVDGEWWAKVPATGCSSGSLRDHEVEEHEDGTITVTPSILMPAHGDRPGWHGYLERGTWREV